jgi:phosphoglycerate dehydrogenase-like enzyme
MDTFRVLFGANLIWPDGTAIMPADISKRLDEASGVSWGYLKEKKPQIEPDQIRGIQTLALSGTRVDVGAFAQGCDDLTCVCLWSLGYDNVDLDACTAAGVAVTRTRGGLLAHSVAAAALSLILALAKRQMEKQQVTRSGRWDRMRDVMGSDIRGKTLGIVGLGDIGRELVRLARPFDMRILASDPFVEPAVFAQLGVEQVSLDQLLASADFVSLHCNLTAETRGLIGAAQLARMKPTSYLINLARGPVVDQRAITVALQERRIAGAALDVFEKEPLPLVDPLLTLDNVILTPHCLGNSHDSHRAGATKLVDQILQVARGDVPEDVLNTPVLDAPPFKAKMARIAGRVA